ncbi:MAG: ABC transporter permease [Candidatus Bathyanammoxibius sp.]
MAADTVTRAEQEPKRHSLLVGSLIRLVREKPLGTAGGVIVLAMLFAGLFADLAWIGLPDVGLAPYGYKEIALADRLAPPSGQHILGTDQLGRDTLTRIIYGARISMVVGVGGTVIGTLGALVIGLLSGYAGGKVDLVVQRFVDAFMCFPTIFILLTVMTLVGPGMIQVTVVLGVLFSIWYSRVVRSAVIDTKTKTYVEAARAVGSSNSRILLRHILPNIMAPVIVIFTISIGQIILSEATLSFLGYGIPPPTPSWGGMLSIEGRKYMLGSPWLAVWPGLALSMAVYGTNMLGDAIRDILDPRLRGRLGRYGTVKVKRKIKVRG